MILRMFVMVLMISVLLIGCGGSGDPVGPETGTITINPEPNSIEAPWQITGPDAFSQSGSGDVILRDLLVGGYTLTWGAVPGWARPSPTVVTEMLVASGTLMFTGTYVAQTGSIVIDVEPNSINAPWQIFGPNSFSLSGAGDSTLENMAIGDYALTWGVVSGWIVSPSLPQTLDTGATVTFTASYIEDTVQLDGFVLIIAGTFTMGSPYAELGHFFNESQHQVTLTQSFYMSKYEVTIEQWDQVLGSGTSTSQLPMVNWSWYQAIEYCNALSMQNGYTPVYEGWGTNWTWNQAANGYRMPTESEWEYACRAGSTTAFSNGTIAYTDCIPIDPSLDTVGWYCGNTSEQSNDVGQKQANGWGLYDMHGNVYEWCWDWYGSYPYPVGVVDPVGPSTGVEKVIRGGSTGEYAARCRSAWRGRIEPGSGNTFLGFRPVRSAN